MNSFLVIFVFLLCVFKWNNENIELSVNSKLVRVQNQLEDAILDCKQNYSREK